MASQSGMVRDQLGGLATAVINALALRHYMRIEQVACDRIIPDAVALLDSRCPPVLCPPSLRTYVQSLKPRKEVVLVRTVSDLVGPAALQG